MKKKSKAFDCVTMKNEIQQKLMSRWQGMTDTEVIQKIRRDLNESNSPIANWWRALAKDSARGAKETAVSH